MGKVSKSVNAEDLPVFQIVLSTAEEATIAECLTETRAFLQDARKGDILAAAFRVDAPKALRVILANAGVRNLSFASHPALKAFWENAINKTEGARGNAWRLILKSASAAFPGILSEEIESVVEMTTTDLQESAEQGGRVACQIASFRSMVNKRIKDLAEDGAETETATEDAESETAEASADDGWQMLANACKVLLNAGIDPDTILSRCADTVTSAAPETAVEQAA